MNSVNSTTTFETKQETKQEQAPLYHILEKQAKGFEDFGKRMSLEFHSTCQEYIKQQNELNLRTLYPGLYHCQCQEKDEIISSLKARIEELENDSHTKSQDIKKLQKNVQYLHSIVVKKGLTDIKEIDFVQTAKITVTTDVGEEIYDSENSESTKLVDNEDIIEENDYKSEFDKDISKDKLSVESNQYYNDIRASYSDSAMDMFTDDDDSSTTGDSIKTENSNYDHPSEWLDVSPTLKQRNKVDKRNLDRWNSKMANNGLLPITLVGKVDEERERKIQTHRKRYSTSAIWLKTYENQRKQDQRNHDQFKLPSFNFSFNTSDDKQKQKESKDLPAPISLKSSVSTSLSDLYTTTLPTTATTSLQPYELLEHRKNKPLHYSKSQQLLSQYK